MRGPPIPMDDTSTALRSMSEDRARHVEGLTAGRESTVPETCRVLGISKSSYYAALREGRRQALETAEAA